MPEDKTLHQASEAPSSSSDEAMVHLAPEVLQEFIEIALTTIRASADHAWREPISALDYLGNLWFGGVAYVRLSRPREGRRPMRVAKNKQPQEIDRIVPLMVARAAKAGGVPKRVYDAIVDLARNPGARPGRSPLPVNASIEDFIVWGRREEASPRKGGDQGNSRDIVNPVGDGEKRQDELRIDWAGRSSGVSSFEYFESKFGSVPYDDRPSADEIRRASLPFYRSLAKHQSRQGLSIGDLFPIDPHARGGAKVKGGGDLSHEALLARLERQRESRRRSMAKWRAKKAQPD